MDDPASDRDFATVSVTVGDGMWPEYSDPAYRMPDQIEYAVESGEEGVAGGVRELSIAIERFAGQKAYLGGLRSKLSGMVYHHAETQTPVERSAPVKSYQHMRTRETQTFETRTVSVQVLYSLFLIGKSAK